MPAETSVEVKGTVVKKSIAAAVALIGSIALAVGLESGTASAHKVLVSGVAECVENGEWTITWTLLADNTTGTDSWAVLTPNGYSPDGAQAPDLPFTRTETVPARIDRVTEGVEVEWTLDGRRVFYAKGWATVRQPTDPCTAATTTTTTVPATTTPTTTTVPATTTTVPGTTTTVPGSTTTTVPDTTTTVPDTTSTTAPPDEIPPEDSPPVTSPPGNTPPDDTPPGDSPPDDSPPGQTDDPDDTSTSGELPETGSDATRQALTIALVLLVVGGAAFVAAQPMRRDEPST